MKITEAKSAYRAKSNRCRYSESNPEFEKVQVFSETLLTMLG